jgi:hypothetical protein
MSPRKTPVTAEEVTAAAEAQRAASARLEELVVAFRETGATMAVIADAAGYSPPGILGILRRHGAA